ncbi:cation diffusion facilitator 1 [Kwoniella heveanensis CBS 569]|uniref:Cation diffusion facilitator 1 n=1 Tax=Kwoniella heveanensis BCC8398 TaxID=1296120 RepID=A0A1B9H486_9TREE|nr:cation diffusion facilitator 1 [Kwoniella heveanensis BCC8398]OCF44660.1 cation diffusion facilitator 1 [Kwoniella heveanensis CBS 569]
MTSGADKGKGKTLPSPSIASATAMVDAEAASRRSDSLVEGGPDDLELMGIPSVISREAGERDPLLLRDKIISEADIEGIRQRKKGGKLADFYESQNSRIQDLLKPLSAMSAEAQQAAEDSALKVKIAVNVSFFCNICLAILQLYAAISSGSLALFASCVDAVDPFANLILWTAHRASAKAEEKKWPVRGSRFETSEWNSSSLLFANIMTCVNVVLIVQSIQEFATHKGDDLQKFHVPSLIAVGIAFGVKFGLFLYCMAIRHSSSQVQVLWEDHRNDLFTNGFGILTAAGGAKLAWWIDPMGASIIALAIIFVWCRTAYEQFTFLGGISAPPEFISLVTYKALTFSEHITSVDTVRVYHSGPQYVVEVDIVLPPEMPLWQAHDIAQDLQDGIERLGDVDRCFVHVDHEVDHKPEHRKNV